MGGAHPTEENKKEQLGVWSYCPPPDVPDIFWQMVTADVIVFP